MANIGLICARSGSKGIKNKNIKIFKGKPLIYWSIRQLLLLKKRGIINRIIVSTDTKKIATIAKKYGAEVPFIRPRKLSSSNSAEWKVWKHAINFLEKKENYKIHMFINLPVTSPCRKFNDILKGINKYKSKKYEIVTAMKESDRSPYFNIVKKKGRFIDILLKTRKKIYHRQSVPRTYDLTTAFHISNPKTIKKKNHLFDCKVGSLLIDKISAIDIDDIHDFNFAKKNFKMNA